MIKLKYNSVNDVSLFRSHMSVKNVDGKEISSILPTIRQGTTIFVENANLRPEKHRGQYYILFMAEYDSVYLFYLDVSGNLRIVYSGAMDKCSNAIYSNIADETELTILKSDGKRAYRVAVQSNDAFEVIPQSYKNKSSAVVPIIYMNFFDAINTAVTLHRKKKAVKYYVISPKNTVMFSVG